MVEAVQVIQDPMTRTGFIILGILGGTIYLWITIFYYRVVQNMKPDKETAIAKFFLKEETIEAFKVLTVSGFIIVFLMGLEVYGMIMQLPEVSTFARAAYPLPMIGLTYFSYTLQKVTRKN